MSDSVSYIEHIKRADSGNPDSIRYLENSIYEDIIDTISSHIEELLLLDNNSYALCDVGDYYRFQENFEKMKEYYQKAIALGNVPAMNNMAFYYESIKEYDEMLKYYQMAIDKGFSYAMNNLGHYYKDIGDEESMLKYYYMAYEAGNTYVIMNMITYYMEIEDLEMASELYFELSVRDPIAFQKYQRMIKNDLSDK